jgi:AraC-like DNA-binding protein
MSFITPEYEINDDNRGGIRYLEHGSRSELIRWHTHEACELHLIVASRGKVFVGDYIGRFEPGQLILTGPRVPHNWVSDRTLKEDVELRDMVVQFDAEPLTQLGTSFPEAGELNSILELSRSGLEFVDVDLQLAISMMTEIRDSSGLDRLLAFFRLLNMLNKWPMRRVLSTMQIDSTTNGVMESKINTVVEYVVSHYPDEISLGQAASLAGMSDSAFSRKFHKATGNKFVEFVNRVRIGRACIMLAETNDQVSSICYEVGFNNVANFNRQFSRLKGKTPGEYRKIMRQNLGRENDTIIAENACP